MNQVVLFMYIAFLILQASPCSSLPLDFSIQVHTQSSGSLYEGSRTYMEPSVFRRLSTCKSIPLHLLTILNRPFPRI